MRWFWLFILGLVLLTGGLYTLRVRTEAAIAGEPTSIASAESGRSAGLAPRLSRSERTRPSQPETQPETQPEIQPEIQPEAEPEPAPEVQADPDPEPAPEQSPKLSPESSVQRLINSMIELADELPEEPVDQSGDQSSGEPSAQEDQAQEVSEDVAAEPEPEPAIEPEQIVDPEPAPESEAAPSYKLRADGSFIIVKTGEIVMGTGTQVDPFMLEWKTLRAIEQDYNPKQGKDHLPDWLDLLHERQVRIVGNTLVPVIATTTRELLVMQNPWDGCCIGIPPSPYDAIEVTLDHDVDFGNSAVGYGTVEGVFILDPYVVDGWVLGMYIIEHASYRSGDGVPFPEF